MARADPIRNTYEEYPDEIKELTEKEANNKGQRPAATVSRSTLFHDHEWHLKSLAQSVPSRNLVLPAPYPPSRTPLSEGNQLLIKDLLIRSRNPKDFILLRTLTEPYVFSSCVAIVEDEHGEAARLTACNLEDTMHDPIISRNTVLAVKQPCWSMIPGGGLHIRVDQPSDLVLLAADDKMVPPAWRTIVDLNEEEDAVILKKEGDSMFLTKRFRKALELYNMAIERLQSKESTVALVDLYRKRCGVNLVLLQFDDAARDLSRAVSIYAKANDVSSRSDLTDPSIIEAWLHDRSTEDPAQIASCLSRPLKDLAARIKFDLGINQTNAEYDFQLIASYVGPLTLHVDAATYASDIEVKQTERHGRGIFAKRAFKTGDLVLAEKAFALPGYFFNDRGSECSLYSIDDGTATDRAGALLFKELVQKLKHNPSLRKDFFDMDDGGYWKKHGWDIKEGSEIPVDVFHIEHIRRRNCFSAPLRSLDLLTAPASVRNGFWIRTSYINHSCLPNSVRTFIGDVLLLRATRDISEGEEITAQYIAPELKYADRQQSFMQTWGFECDCKLCAIDKSIAQTSEAERMALFEELKAIAQKLGNKPTVTALKKFAKRLRDLEALFDDATYADFPRLCLVHPTLFLTEAWRSLNNMDRMIEAAIKLLRNFGIFTRIDSDTFETRKNSGLVNVETVRALKYLAEGYENKKEENLAIKIRDVARCWFRVITGSDVGVEEFFKA